jgi:hypothetical protein
MVAASKDSFCRQRDVAPDIPPYAAWPSDGLPLRQALLRTVDPDLKDSWERAQQALREAGGRRRRRVLSHGIYDADPDRSRADDYRGRLERDETASEREMLANFVSHFASSKLVATGSRGSPTAPRALIPSFSWNDLGFRSWERSMVMERTKEKLCWYGVTAVPLLHSSARAGPLAGKTLKEAFQVFVLDDPEVVARSKSLFSHSPEYAKVFKEGRYTVAGWEQWPIARSSGYACLTTREPHLIGCLNDDAELPDVIAACDALHDRFEALFDVLRKGEVSVRAASARSGHPDSLLRSIWSHPDYYFEFAGVDILQINHESRDQWDTFKRVWLAAILESPSAAQLVDVGPRSKATGGNQRPRSRNRQAIRKAEHILAAAAKARIDVFDRSLSARKTADQLAQYMPSPPRSELELHALEKAILRMRNADRHAG